MLYSIGSPTQSCETWFDVLDEGLWFSLDWVCVGELIKAEEKEI
jgi:hypothetical protein